MNIGIIIAMEEEFQAIDFLLIKEQKPYKIYTNQINNHNITGIISGIGKAASASATTLLIEKYKCDIIINIGSCGGLNQAKVASFIISNSSGYSDVDVTGFGYKLGQLPNQPEYFQSKSKILNINSIITTLQNTYPNILNGFVITNDSFINKKDKVEEIKNIYPNTIAVDMEAAAIAQICHLYDKEFIFIKKVSDMADQNATVSFKEEIAKMHEKTGSIVKLVLENI